MEEYPRNPNGTFVFSQNQIATNLWRVEKPILEGWKRKREHFALTWVEFVNLFLRWLPSISSLPVYVFTALKRSSVYSFFSTLPLESELNLLNSFIEKCILRCQEIQGEDEALLLRLKDLAGSYSSLQGIRALWRSMNRHWERGVGWEGGNKEEIKLVGSIWRSWGLLVKTGQTGKMPMVLILM